MLRLLPSQPVRASWRFFATVAEAPEEPANGARAASRPLPEQTGGEQFKGSYISRHWARRFILGCLLQRYDPPSSYLATQASSPSVKEVDKALLHAQQVLSTEWGLAVKPLDTVSEARIFRLLAKYACGESLLSDEAAEELDRVLSCIPQAPCGVEDAARMYDMLECVGYIRRGDNIHRVAYGGELHYPPQTHAMMQEHLSPARQQDGGDPYDCIREWRRGPAYAIDSASTSEVDDAIGVHWDDHCSGSEKNPYFVVYVSDATVYCPFDSALEQMTARRLTTTTYLPEGVYFMLPKPIVEAATLREDRPCRTFNIRFRIDEETGALKDYSVSVGWLEQLRRITYDQVQALVDAAEKPGKPLASASPHPPPAWMEKQDAANMAYILQCARVRLRARLQRQQEHSGGGDSSSGDFSLPDPLIKVVDTRVVSLTDQIVSTQDARLAVAELMIAANEVCSRVAQSSGLAIPFRGTRVLSQDHLVAQHFAEPDGVETLSSLDAAHTYLAEAMQQSVRRLSSVTRAIYSHEPLHHAGLDTTFYAHTTSPLRRYADMLVHHQLKTWLWEQHGGGTQPAGASQRRRAPQEYIPEYSMATLCNTISTKQERASLLQDASSRFWTLRYMEDAVAASAGVKKYLCLVGGTRRVAASTVYNRFRCTARDTQATVGAAAPLLAGRWCQPAPEFIYVSDIYLPEVQLAHALRHSCASLRVGAVVECTVERVVPEQGVLDLKVIRVMEGGDERQLEQLWMGGLASGLDA